MNTRSLLLSLVTAATMAACTIDIPKQTPCTDDKNCPTGQICGEDGFCRADNGCKGDQNFIKRCDGACVDLRTTLNCGACGVACTSDQVCTQVSGKYQCAAHCAPGLDVCSEGGGTSCRDLTADPDHCGDCNTACQAGFVCQPDAVTGHGRCVISCPAGTPTACGDHCVDLQNDNNNCGSCGRACTTHEKCVAGGCKPICTASQTECSPGQCVDLLTDRNNCGSCGHALPAGFVCVNGAQSLTCPAGTNICNGSCVDETTDPNNCGGCTPPGTSQFKCDSGYACKVDPSDGKAKCTLSCAPGETNCNGKCVDTTSDPNNCGSCASNGAQFVCGSGKTCQSSTCTPTCLPGQNYCSTSGKCVDFTSDFANCGSCGHACASGQVCSNSQCQTSCQAPQLNCSGSCRDTQNDPNNCGGCGIPCANGQVCSGGVCSVSCPAGSINCGGTCVDPLHDNANCGGCSSGGSGQACTTGNTCKPQVVSGVTKGVCTPDCASASACNGVCKDLAHDPANCGSCGNACASNQTCNNGSCQLTCPSTMSVCDIGGGAQACKDTQNDPANCGACGIPCAGGQVCVSGLCQTSCPSGQTACNGSCTNTTYDPANCGGCAGGGGTACAAPSNGNGSAYCVNGTCGVACNGTFATCSDSASSCDIDLASDANHCGGCLNKCAAADNATAACAAGKCGVNAAASNFGNCDGNLANGFESNFQYDAAHCGGCAGTVCGAGAPFCTSGACNTSIAGVQQNLSISKLPSGWQQCYAGTYGDTTAISTIQASCNQNWVLVGCRASGSDTLIVAAAGLASDVFQTGAPHSANQVTWYFDGSSAWGFAPQGASLNLAPCDIAGSSQDNFAQPFGSQRMCWLTSSNALAAGIRCGDQTNLGPGSTYERVIFTKP